MNFFKPYYPCVLCIPHSNLMHKPQAPIFHINILGDVVYQTSNAHHLQHSTGHFSLSLFGESKSSTMLQTRLNFLVLMFGLLFYCEVLAIRD